MFLVLERLFRVADSPQACSLICTLCIDVHVVVYLYTVYALMFFVPLNIVVRNFNLLLSKEVKNSDHVYFQFTLMDVALSALMILEVDSCQ